MPSPLPADLAARLQQAVGASLRVEELLGTGGFAAVYRAHDPLLARDVAVKVLLPGTEMDGDAEAAFLHEARALAGVEHPHIVPLYDAAARGGLLYLVMRLLPGQPLRERMRPGEPLPVAEAVRIGREVASALSAAATRGVVHRDIKPENILLDTAGNALVTDFGIAAVGGRAREATGYSMGTPKYMSPEQGLGEPVDARSDVYACGVLLFELLTGTLPFEGTTPVELIGRRLAGPAPLVSERAPDTPARLVALVARMLARVPADRPDAAGVAAELAAIGTRDGLRSPRQVRRRRLMRVGGVVAVAGVAGALALGGAVTVAVQLARLLLSPGPEPVLAVTGAAIPDSLVRMARADGSLAPGEPVLGVFIAAGRTFDDALVATDRALLWRSRGRPTQRYDSAGNRVLSFNVRSTPPEERARGAPPLTADVVVNSATGRTDTVLRTLGGPELRRLLSVADAVKTGMGRGRAGRDGTNPSP